MDLIGIPDSLVLPYCYFCHVGLTDKNKSNWLVFVETLGEEVRAVSQCKTCEQEQDERRIFRRLFGLLHSC